MAESWTIINNHNKTRNNFLYATINQWKYSGKKAILIIAKPSKIPNANFPQNTQNSREKNFKTALKETKIDEQTESHTWAFSPL